MASRRAVQQAALLCTEITMRLGLDYDEGRALFRTLGFIDTFLSDDHSDEGDAVDAAAVEAFYERELHKIKVENLTKQ